ncbi:MAG: hypothetical protein H7A51_14865 [Akkermansiaceae bacterium]|nr:hypothetical protein [Akkermansiaceae bacterium]
MKNELSHAELPAADPDLVSLVDAYLEDHLDADRKRELEQRLENESAVRDYFVDRLRLHAELHEILQPALVEIVQKRHILLDYKRGLPSVSARQTHVIRIGDRLTRKFIELPPDAGGYKIHPLFYVTVGLGLMAVLLSAFFIFRGQRTQPVPPPKPPTLVFRNPGFEAVDLADDDDAFTFTLPDWQDYFLSQDTGTCDLSRFSDGKYQAHSGNNVAVIKWRGYVTQRLKYSDGSDLLARKGLHLRVRGWVLAGDVEHEFPLRFALRVVKNIKPEMLQYEPCYQILKLKGSAWKKFQVDLVLPAEGLVLSPSDADPGVRDRPPLDITGHPLTLTADNRGGGVFFLDDLSVEIVPQTRAKNAE